METYRKIESIVSRITYKLGWTFSSATSPISGPNGERMLEVRIIMRVPNINNPTEIGPVGFPVFFFFDREYSEEEIIRKIMHGVKELEMHEVKEWFKVEGKQVENPHPELNKEWHYVK